MLSLFAAFLIGVFSALLFGWSITRKRLSTLERNVDQPGELAFGGVHRTFAQMKPWERAELSALLEKSTVHPLSEIAQGPQHHLILTARGEFLEMSEEFCALVGYSRDELQGKPIDWLTAPETVHIPRHRAAVFRFGSCRALWMFVHREGRPILVRYEWRLLSGLSIEMTVEALGNSSSVARLPSLNAEDGVNKGT